MRVRKTKSGKFSLEVTSLDRSTVWDALVSFMEGESVKMMDVKLDNEKNIMRHIYYSTLDQLIARIDFALFLINVNKKWIVTRSEVIALMWLLRYEDSNMQILDMKAALHKTLHA